MRELINLVNESVSKGLLPNIISGFELGEGIYIRYHDINNIKEDDVLIIESKKEIVADDLYNWFKNRNFYDGLMFNVANKALDSSKKRILGVNAHGLMVKYSNTLKNDDVTFEESLFIHYEKIKEINDHIDIDINYEVDTNLKLIEYAYENYKSLIDKKPDIKLCFYKANSSENDFENSYMKYIDTYFFSKNEAIEFDGKLFGTNPYQNTYNKKKPSLCPVNGIRRVPYVISKDEGMGAIYLSKMSYNQIDLLVKSAFNSQYEIAWGNKGALSNFNQIKKSNEKLTFVDGDFLTSFTYNRELKACSQKDLLNKLDGKNLFNNIIKDTIFKYINSSKDMSNIIKLNSKKITNISLIQEVVSNRDILNGYYLNNKVNIENIFKSMCKNIYIYRLKECESLSDLNKLRYPFIDIVNILANVDKKGEFNAMPSKINELLNKFDKQILAKEIEIDTEEDFYFLAGQAIRFLMGLKESDKQKSNILGNSLIRNCSSIKEELIKSYQKYSHAIPAYSLAPINLVYQELLLFDEKCNKNKIKNELWFYYQAGLVGKNLFYIKKEKAGGNKNEDE